MCELRNFHHLEVIIENVESQEERFSLVIADQSHDDWKPNHPKDKMDSRYLNSFKGNIVEFIVPTNTDRFKGKEKKNQR